ncbi:hypothetical protein EYR36_007584 [Pleurotus pulmonarius]|nr:hypothetical protein EYR36_007584 [Pleurotus pulmonarius]
MNSFTYPEPAPMAFQYPPQHLVHRSDGHPPNGISHHVMHPQQQPQPPQGYSNGDIHHRSHPNDHGRGHFNQEPHLGGAPNFPHQLQPAQMAFPQFVAAMGGAMNMAPFQPYMSYFQQPDLGPTVPLGSSEDQSILVDAVHRGKREGRTHRQAIEELNGNNYPSQMWKDYYLDHHDAIEALVAKKANAPVLPVRGARKPTFSDIESDSPEKPVSQPIRPKVKPKPRPSLPSRPVVKNEPVEMTKLPPAPRRRQTINSLTAPTAVYTSKLPAPVTDIRIPEPPSREPTPPTNVIQTSRGNKYTPEDREYFIQFISWRLKEEPELSKMQLCEELAEKVPHHTAASWGSHWALRHELADKILAHAKSILDAEEDEKATRGPNDGKGAGKVQTASSSAPLRRPNYKDSSSASEEPSESEAELTDADAHGSDDEDTPPVKKEVSTRARPITFGDEDLKLMARHIADTRDWDGRTNADRWKLFTDKHTYRSHRAWMEQYRRRKTELDRMAAKIKRKRAAEASRTKVIKEEHHSDTLQTPTPCPPSKSSDTYGPPAKRKFPSGVDSSGRSERIKRSKDIYT